MEAAEKVVAVAHLPVPRPLLPDRVRVVTVEEVPVRREYKSGSRWALWRWTRLCYKGVPYMDRLHLVKTPWFSVMLHFFQGPDPHPDPHDHPVAFVSFVLRGWYREIRYGPVGTIPYREMRHPRAIPYQIASVRWLNFKRPSGIHRIVAVKPGTVTLVVAGPVVRDWGYYTVNGWRHWRAYGAGK